MSVKSTKLRIYIYLPFVVNMDRAAAPHPCPQNAQCMGDLALALPDRLN